MMPEVKKLNLFGISEIYIMKSHIIDDHFGSDVGKD
jgi:hypothetical protein